MKVEARLFMFLWVFFAVVTVIYLGSNFVIYRHVEPIGTTVFALSCLMSLMIWFYLVVVGRKMDHRPEDIKTGEVVDGAGTLGFFPPRSIWPFASAAVLSVVLLGPIFGWWLTILGVVVGIWVCFGWCYEFYVGEYRH